MTIEQATADLLKAYQKLEDAQAQAQQMQAYLRQCELRKIQCEAVVAALTQKES